MTPAGTSTSLMSRMNGTTIQTNTLKKNRAAYSNTYFDLSNYGLVCYVCHIFEKTCGYRLFHLNYNLLVVGIVKDVVMVEIHYTAVTMLS